VSKLARIALVFAAACAAPIHAQDPAYDGSLPEGYTCCNLHYDRDWISDGNWSTFPMIPAGTRIKVLSYGSNRASVEIDGKNFRIGHDYGRADESLESFIRKLVVKEDPREKIVRYPDAIREGIRLGKITSGMTREQAIIAAGYPPTHMTKILDTPVWSYWNHRLSRWSVTWDEQGQVREIVGQR
jgi:hypothetical protein